MTDDIVARLRESAEGWDECDNEDNAALERDAADEIERFRSYFDAHSATIQKQADEIERLRWRVKITQDAFVEHGGRYWEARWRDEYAENQRLREALLWCGGSADFGPEGQAREGWQRICAPLLKEPTND